MVWPDPSPDPKCLPLGEACMLASTACTQSDQVLSLLLSTQPFLTNDVSAQRMIARMSVCSTTGSVN
jgi:hypothetical protein